MESFIESFILQMRELRMVEVENLLLGDKAEHLLLSHAILIVESLYLSY